MRLVILGHHHDLEQAVIAVRPAAQLALTTFTHPVAGHPNLTGAASCSKILLTRPRYVPQERDRGTSAQAIVDRKNSSLAWSSG
jgi:hypothetical protein